MTTTTQINLPVGTWAFDKTHTALTFIARHMMVTKVRGHFPAFDGSVEVAENPADSKVNVIIEAASVTTGAPDRDAHLISPDFFDVGNFPTIKFVSTEFSQANGQWLMTGDLTIKDVTRPVTLDVTFEGTNTNPWGKTVAGFSASTEVDREDWGLTWNLALETGGVLLSKKVKLEIETELMLA
ncbi:MAG: YceI family protein [Acidimicrobiia bacterium]